MVLVVIVMARVSTVWLVGTVVLIAMIYDSMGAGGNNGAREVWLISSQVKSYCDTKFMAALCTLDRVATCHQLVPSH